MKANLSPQLFLHSNYLNDKPFYILEGPEFKIKMTSFLWTGKIPGQNKLTIQQGYSFAISNVCDNFYCLIAAA